MRSQITHLARLFALLVSMAAMPVLMGCSGHTTIQIDGKTVAFDGIPGGNRAEATVQQRIATDTVDSLDIATSAGNIEVRAGDGDSNTLMIRATKYVTGKQTVQQLKAYLPQVKVTQHLQSGTLVVRSDVAEGALPDGVGYYVSYVVTVPTRLAVVLKTASGDIGIRDLRGGVRADTSSGGIELKAVAGELELHSVSGDIAVEDAPDASAVTIETSSGTVDLTHIAGRFAARSISGDITVEGATVADGCKAESSSGTLKFSDIRAADRKLALSLTSVSGDIAYSGDAAAIDVHTSSGNIEIAATDAIVPSEVKAGSISGNLSLKLPGMKSARINAHTVSGNLSLPGDYSEGDGHSATITLGDGATPVTLNSSSGDIALGIDG